MNHDTLKRLYIFTGKGGVGKTTLSMAFTKFLESKNLKVKYNCFHQTPEKELWEKLKLPVIELHLEESAEIYIGRKLKSTTIASWIMKSHFFKSLFQMIPGLGHMILLGHIIDELENDPELIVVLDSPASGHALTMFESSSNFKKIFGAGMIVKDIDRMERFLTNPKSLKTNVITLPTELSSAEALELLALLKTNLPDIQLNSELYLNDSYLIWLKENISHSEINKIISELPFFLKDKVSIEEKLLESFSGIPHVNQNDMLEVIKKLSPNMEQFQ